MLLKKLQEMTAGKRVLLDPSVYLDNRRRDVDRMRDRLLAAQERQLAGKKQRFGRLAASLDAMSPLRVLGRGYALASDGAGKLIKSVKELTPGDLIRVRFSDGCADCRVDSLDRGE